MIFKSPMIAEASGSLAGNVFSHNAGGKYIRERVTPTNPKSARQTTIRGFFTQLAQLWAALTSSQRTNWESYAANLTRVNALGDSKPLTGRQVYIGNNVLRLDAGETVIAEAPTGEGLAQLSPVSGSVSAANSSFEVNYTATDAWACNASGSMIVYTSPPQPPTVNNYHGPYRKAGVVAGAANAPASPAIMTCPFGPVASGQKLFLKAVAVDAEGRRSAEQKSQTADAA